tara:strand:- start:2110 stop:3105 length:996 start_codon:yes stop_codon:yes gene_type:complete
MQRPVIVTHHELTLKIDPIGRKNPTTPLTKMSIFDVLKKLKSKGYEGKDRKFEKSRFCGLFPIIEVSNSNDRIDLILCLSDKDADNQVVRDFNNIQVTRPLTRKKNEGVDSVVHIVISFKKSNPSTARFAIERKSGLTPKLFVDTLNYFVRDLCKSYPNDFKGVHPTKRDEKGRPIELPLKLRFVYESVLSDEIIDAFENGRVKDVLFHKQIPKSQSIDPAGNFVPKKNTVHLDVKGKLIRQKSETPEDKMQDLKDGFNFMISNDKSLKNTTFTIKFKNKDNQSQTAYYDATFDEFSLAKKTYFPESIKEPVSQPLKLNKRLCGKMYLQIQ